MKIRFFLPILFFLFMADFAFSQCSVNFGSNAGTLNFSTYSGDIVHAIAGETYRLDSFDVWQDDSNKVLSCSSSGGLWDFSVELKILPTFDVYQGAVIDSLAGVRHDVVQSNSGLRGSLPFNTSGVSESSTGDVKAYTIQVRFADHVVVKASDFAVNFSSGNTDASVFESCLIEFLDSQGQRYAPATYTGYYDSGAPTRVDTACPSGFVDSAGYVKNSTPWKWTGNGTFAAQSNQTVDINDVCNPINGIRGAEDDEQVNPVTHAGLSIHDRIGGFSFTVYAEDVAGSSSDSGFSSSKTSTNTILTSTLNGFTISGSLPVTWLNFDVKKFQGATLIGWSTASELNNSHFEVEKFEDDIGFLKIGEVLGAGHASDIRHYEFIDPYVYDFKGYYYRLKQVDFDGNYQYSEIRSFRSDPEKEGVVFPNPMNQIGQFCFGNYVLKGWIFDPEGRIVQEFDSIRKDACLTLKTEGWQAGIYFIKVIFEDRSVYINRFVVSH
jgi:hypothetical protein